MPYIALFESLRFVSACSKLFTGYNLLYERMVWFGYGGAITSKLLNIPLVRKVNGDHISELEMLGYRVRGPKMWLSTVLMSIAIRQASLVVATGKVWQKRFVEQWKIDPARIVIVENGTDVTHLLNMEKLCLFQSDKSTNRITIIYVGDYEPWHGINS